MERAHAQCFGFYVRSFLAGFAENSTAEAPTLPRLRRRFGNEARGYLPPTQAFHVARTMPASKANLAPGIPPSPGSGFALFPRGELLPPFLIGQAGRPAIQSVPAERCGSHQATGPQAAGFEARRRLIGLGDGCRDRGR